jgi:D-alanyl-lipoteichoic acid acyltransferase DltB (MBOAT superfamily)
MLLSGLWHGASWSFVLWGAYHAALITGYRLVTKRIPRSIRKSTLGKPVAIGIMYFFTVLGWMIFRETDIDRLLGYFVLNPLQATPDQWLATAVMMAMCLFTATPLVIVLVLQRIVAPRIPAGWMLPARTTSWALCVVLMFLFVRMNLNDFIYFAF